MNTQQELVVLARKIAVHCGYLDLVKGLQPVARLEEKYKAEWIEFEQAIAEGKERVWLLSEAADLLYYAACIDAQLPFKRYSALFSILVLKGVSRHEAEAAALAKYRLRDERNAKGLPKDFVAENAAILEALGFSRGSMQQVRRATLDDVQGVKAIADANRTTLGFILRSVLIESINFQWVLVAERGSRLVGFMRYRHRRDSQTTIYELCVDQEYRGQGIGRLLIEVLAQEAQEQGKSQIQLKAISGIAANGFYERIGFTLVGVETGRKRALNVWRLVWM